MAVKINSERKGVSINWEPGDFEGLVTIIATGENGDVHSKVPVPNSGEAGLFFPVDFSGKMSVEVRDPFDSVIDSGILKV